jgi:predicted nucleic acid-binding Zn ribbon protein
MNADEKKFEEDDELHSKLFRLVQEMEDTGYVFKLQKVVRSKKPVEKSVIAFKGTRFFSKTNDFKPAKLAEIKAELKEERFKEFIGAIVEAAYLGGYNVTIKQQKNDETAGFEDGRIVYEGDGTIYTGKIFVCFDPVSKDAGNSIMVMHK